MRKQLGGYPVTVVTVANPSTVTRFAILHKGCAALVTVVTVYRHFLRYGVVAVVFGEKGKHHAVAFILYSFAALCGVCGV